MVKWLPNKFVNAYFWIFMKEIFHILIYKCTDKPIHHTQTLKFPEHSPMNLFGNLLTITYRSLPNCQIGKAFRKTLLNQFYAIATLFLSKLSTIFYYSKLLKTLLLFWYFVPLIVISFLCKKKLTIFGDIWRSMKYIPKKYCTYTCNQNSCYKHKFSTNSCHLKIQQDYILT